MEIVLMIVTVVSLVLAVGMSIVGWTLLRGDRRRSAARVEALGALASAEDAAEPVRVAPRVAPPAPLPSSARFVSLDETGDDREAWNESWEIEPESWDIGHDTAPLPPRERAAPSASASDRVRPSHALAAVSDDMFGAAVERRAPVRRWLALAAVVVVMAGGAGVVYAVYRPALLSAAGKNTDTATATQAINNQPLELLSLTHATDADGNFSLTGLVQNPAGAQAIRGIVVVIYLFDRGGNYFASGKAALDVTALQPGNESPFVVQVANASRVGRYRVGFRLDDGRVVTHVDRRGQALEGTTTVEDPTRAPGTARVKGSPGA